MNSVTRYLNSIIRFSGQAFHQVTRINLTLFTVQCHIKLYYVLANMCLFRLMLFACYKLFPLYSHAPRPYVTQHNLSLIRGVLLKLEKFYTLTTAENPKQDFFVSYHDIPLFPPLPLPHCSTPLPHFIRPSNGHYPPIFPTSS